MRRRSGLLLYGASIGLLVALAWAPPRFHGDVRTVLVVALATSLACGALSLRVLRPILVEAGEPAPAAALLASATLAATIPLFLLVATPTVSLALAPPRLATSAGGLIGLALAAPALVRAWRSVEIDEWRPLALSALAMGVTLAPGGDMWFPLLGVVGVQAWAFLRCFRLARERDAYVLSA